MRDVKRIQPLVAELELLWKRYPDMRLGQIIANITRDSHQFGPMGDLFYIEDEPLMQRLRELLK